MHGGASVQGLHYLHFIMPNVLYSFYSVEEHVWNCSNPGHMLFNVIPDPCLQVLSQQVYGECSKT